MRNLLPALPYFLVICFSSFCVVSAQLWRLSFPADVNVFLLPFVLTAGNECLLF